MAKRPEVKEVEKAREALEEMVAAMRDAEFTTPSRKKVRVTIAEMRETLERLDRSIDEIAMPDAIFEPSDPRLIGHFVALALLARDRRPLARGRKFYGAGVYAIYYTGDFEPYTPISGTETPIYVGKADPPVGARTVVEQETKLWSRLDEHRKSIEKGAGLDIADFECRALAVQSGFQAAAENHLIRVFQPLWNNEMRIMFGIGKHGDSAETRSNKRSPWDTLHPGRRWAEGNEPGRSREEILEDIRRHFERTPVYQNLDDVFRVFIDGIRRADERIAHEEAEELAEELDLEE